MTRRRRLFNIMFRLQLPCRVRCALSVRAAPRYVTQFRRASYSYTTRNRAPLLCTAKKLVSVSVVENEVEQSEEPKKRRRSVSPKSRMKAVAEKVSAARELARKLAEEKEAAVKTGKQYSEQILKSTETAATEAAVQAAEADSMNRAILLAESGKQKDAELSYLKKLNKALKAMVLDVAPNKKQAEHRLNELFSEFKGPEVLTEAEEEAVAVEEIPTPLPVEELEPEVVPEVDALVVSAEGALESGQPFFTVPSEPPIGKTVQILYNRLAGPLPDGSSVSIKYGLNKWETIANIQMRRCEDLSSVNGEWWEANHALEDLLYRFDFVFMDSVSGLVDNNNSKDFTLKLKGALTKGQLLEKRLNLFDENEQGRNAEFETEIEKLRKEAESMADAAAEDARAKTLSEWESELNERVREVVGERRAQAEKVGFQKGVTKGNKVGWFGDLSPGSQAFLAYNSATGPLQDAQSIRLHLGTDNWYQEAIDVFELRRLSDAELQKYRVEEDCGAGAWWGVSVEIPREAAVLNYVFDDGKSLHWDNNNGQDYITHLANPLSHEQLIEQKKAQLRKELEEELTRRVTGAASAARDRIFSRLDSRIRRWRAQWQYLYTSPIHVQSGKRVEICYRPDLTVLRGRPDVFVRVGFNHWNHSVHHGAVKLEPMIANGIGFERAVIDVPGDAHSMEFVFCDNPDFHGGFVDNNHGFNYHFPVSGSSVEPQPLKILHVTAEMAPIAKVGGLADVVTALGRAVQEEGHSVEVVMPKYDCIDYSQVSNLQEHQSFNFGGSHVVVWRGLVEDLEVTFIEPDNGMFWTGCIYGLHNDAQRFEYFCGAASEYIRIFNISPDVVHCHDWQTAPVVWSDLAGAKTVFTIHNLNYGVDLIGRAMQATSVATTVSPTYATEISGSPAVENDFDKLFGVLNGIDVDIWDPSRDKFLPMNYNAETAIEGKAAVRQELRNRLNLAQIDVPIVGVVTRLTPQKGIHLIKHAAWRTLERGGQFVLLGSAPDPKIQHEFNQLAGDLKAQYPDRAALLFAYDEPMSHLIYAGCDIFLVPSVFEPCGLTQMIAMRYGAVPIVRRTGGLNDTVFDVETDDARARSRGLETNGFNFEGADEMGMDYALNRALGFFFGDRPAWNALSQSVMRQDWSWSLPALDYLSLYYKALG